jgi:hypothetical protein
MKQQNRIMVETACSIAKKTRAEGVLLYADVFEDYAALAKIGQEKGVELILAVKDDSSFKEARSIFKKVLRIPDVPLGRINQIKMAVIQALSKGLVKKETNGSVFQGSLNPKPLTISSSSNLEKSSKSFPPLTYRSCRRSYGQKFLKRP